MLCRKPYSQGVQSYGCGQCLPCRLNRRRIWTHRIMLESLVHEKASFVTLTYDQESVPEDGSVSPRDLQLFLKRLRKRTHPVRFFGVGEYGDNTWRPHYHLALFGLGTDDKDAIHDSWGLGITHTGTLTLDSAQYVAGYTTKKMTSKEDKRLAGRYPEFARMSLRPGIGAPAIQEVAEALQNKNGWDEISNAGDVPNVLQTQGRKLPLGRYMRSRLRLGMNFEVLTQSPEAAYKQSAEMLVMLYDRLLDEESPLQLYKAKQRLQEAENQKMSNQETRFKIFSQKKDHEL
nr:MAG: replication initiator protein [Microvirus sp.]